MVSWTHRFNPKAKWPWMLNSSPLPPKTTCKNFFISLYWVCGADTSTNDCLKLVCSLTLYFCCLLDFTPHIPHHNFIAVALHCQLLPQFQCLLWFQLLVQTQNKLSSVSLIAVCKIAIFLPRFLHLPNPLMKPAALGFSFPVGASARALDCWSWPEKSLHTAFKGPVQTPAAGTFLLLGWPQDHYLLLWWWSPLLVAHAIWIHPRGAFPLLPKSLAKSLYLHSILITNT